MKKGIIIGSLAGAAVMFVVVYMIMKKREKKAAQQAAEKLAAQKNYYDSLMVGASSPAPEVEQVEATGQAAPTTVNAAHELSTY
jgi:hypothetical protein